MKLGGNPLGWIIPLFLAGVFVSGCGPEELQSVWRDREVTIDGHIEDWDGLLQYDEDAGVAVGVVNDDEFVYICMTTGDRAKQMQVMGRGLIVWVDPEGGKDRTSGFKFPLGRMGMGGPPPMPGEGRPDPEAMKEALRESLDDLEILGPIEGQRREITAHELVGFEVTMEFTGGVLAYELKMPLRESADASFAVGLGEQTSFSIGLVTPEFDRSAMMNRRGGMMGGGGGPGGKGGFGGRGGGFGGGPGRSRPQMPEPIDVWIKVQLASLESADSGTDDLTGTTH